MSQLNVMLDVMKITELLISVIGENPRLFGFDFDNPLAGVEEKYTL